TVAAVIYRWVVVFSIVFFLNKVFEPYGLKILGQIMALSGFVGLVAQPVWGLAKFLWTPRSMNKMKKERLSATFCVIRAAIAFVFMVPLPFAVKCTFEIQPRKGQQVFPVIPGLTRVAHVRPGDKVKAGDKLLELDNADLQLQLLDLEGKYREAEETLRVLQ